MLLCDDIIFWWQHNRRPVVLTEYDIAMLEMTKGLRKFGQAIAGAMLPTMKQLVTAMKDAAEAMRLAK